MADRVVVPSVVLGELEFGFLNGTRRDENHRKLMEFLRHSHVEVAVVDHRTAEIYAELLFFLRSKGKPIPTNDIWIAALALEHSLVVYTRDTHFDHLPQIPKIR